MQDDEEREAERRADRHSAKVRRAAGEGAHVEGVRYEDDIAEGAYPESNIDPNNRDATGEGAPLEAPDASDSRDGD